MNNQCLKILVDHMNTMDLLSAKQCGVAVKLAFDYFRDEKTEQEIKQYLEAETLENERQAIMIAFSQLKDSIDRRRSAYERRCAINRENGKKGGAPKGNQNARKK